MPDARAAYLARRDALVAGMHAQGTAAPLGLAKGTSNLFRDRSEGSKQRLDLHHFCHVIEVAPGQGWVDVEGLCTYENLVAGTLQRGAMPAVVPQLKTITIGGAAAGVGIEATSFRHGLVHDTLLELDVLLPHGEIVTCTPENDRRDLFFGFPNSYGTLGYALRLRARVLPVKKYVRVEHERSHDAQRFFDLLAARCGGPADFVDGVVFNANEYVLNTGVFVDEAPWQSDYTYENIYYKSLLEKEVDYLTAHDYVWRWDTDWFWCSRAFGVQDPRIRRLWPRRYRRSSFYWKLIGYDQRFNIADRIEKLNGRPPRERVIQDVELPIERAGEFLDWFLDNVPIEPLWLCPLRLRADGEWPLYPLRPHHTYVNVGFWSSVSVGPDWPSEEGHTNKLIERAVSELVGHKSLYSDAFYSPDEFDELYGGETYKMVKQTYDPDSRLLDLYAKAVQRR